MDKNVIDITSRLGGSSTTNDEPPKLDEIQQVAAQLINKRTTRGDGLPSLFDYESVPADGSYGGLPVHLSDRVVRYVNGVQYVPFFKRGWRIWQNLEPCTYAYPYFVVADLPGFGKRIICHPDVWSALQEEGLIP